MSVVIRALGTQPKKWKERLEKLVLRQNYRSSENCVQLYQLGREF